MLVQKRRFEAKRFRYIFGHIDDKSSSTSWNVLMRPKLWRTRLIHFISTCCCLKWSATLKFFDFSCPIDIFPWFLNKRRLLTLFPLHGNTWLLPMYAFVLGHFIVKFMFTCPALSRTGARSLLPTLHDALLNLLCWAPEYFNSLSERLFLRCE